MKKVAIIPILIIGTLLVAGSAFAWPGGHSKKNCDGFQGYRGQGMTQEQHKDQMKNRLEKMAVILDLTEQQKGQLKTLFEKKWQDQQSMRTKMEASRETLREYKQGNTFDESEFRAMAQKHADLKTEMMVQQAKTRQQIFAVLTPEQQQKAEKLRGMRGEGIFGKNNGEGFHGKRGETRDCDGHGRHNGHGHGQRYNN
jgi:protein CpxP